MAIGLFDLDGDRLVRRDRIELEAAGARTAVPALTGVRAADLLLLNDDDLTYAKVRLDSRSTATVLRHLAALPEPLARALCWASLWDMVRDAELPARDFLRIVVEALPSESDPNLVATTLAHAEGALTFYADPGYAYDGWRALATAARARATAPSASQRIWADTYIRATRADPDLSTVAGWLAGQGRPDGLEISNDLRWQILQALVAAGAAGPEQIDAEAAADPTVSGEVAATITRALIPTAEAKAATWAAIVDPETRMHLRRATLLGFQHPAQTALTEPYVAAYLDALDEVWRDWEFSPARLFAVLAYPSLQVPRDALDRVDRWLADGDRPGPLRRLVSDRRDDMRRALAARARDAVRAPG
jgi:aminopeptidase N